MLLAPGRFSTITGWPRIWPSLLPTMRAATSPLEPAAKPTISRIGRVGALSSGPDRPGMSVSARTSARASRLDNAILLPGHNDRQDDCAKEHRLCPDVYSAAPHAKRWAIQPWFARRGGLVHVQMELNRSPSPRKPGPNRA